MDIKHQESAWNSHPIQLPSVERFERLEAVAKPDLGATAGLPSSATVDAALLNELAVAPDTGSLPVLKLLLLQQWQSETAPLSDLDAIYMHPAYQQIIGMGREALPYIFQELPKPTGLWF